MRKSSFVQQPVGGLEPHQTPSQPGPAGRGKRAREKEMINVFFHVVIA
jgi:hypothetical protein